MGEVFGYSRVATSPLQMQVGSCRHPNTTSLKSFSDLGHDTERINSSQLNYNGDKISVSTSCHVEL